MNLSKAVNILLTLEVMQLRLLALLPLEFQNQEEVEEAIDGALVRRVMLLTRNVIYLTSLQRETPEIGDAPNPPLYWVCDVDLESWVAELELRNVVGKHVSLWIKWKATRTAQGEPLVELIRLWKRRRVPIPGAKHFRHVNPKERYEYEDVETESPTSDAGEVNPDLGQFSHRPY